MECQKLGLNSKQRGCSGFDNIITSVKTVYEAASQEGWVYLMYNTTDAYPAWPWLTDYFFSIFAICQFFGDFIFLKKYHKNVLKNFNK